MTTFAPTMTTASSANGAPGAADAVNIVLIFIRDITVEHDIHIVHINPPGRHIGRNEDPKPALPETVHHLLPLFLRDIPVNALGVNPTQLQKLGDSLCGPFRIAKAHTAVKAGLQKETGFSLRDQRFVTWKQPSTIHADCNTHRSQNHQNRL